MSFETLEIAGGAALLAFVVHVLTRHQMQKHLSAAELRYSRLAAKKAETSEHLQTEKEERARLQQVEEAFQTLVARIPWIIRDLMECNDAREVPDRALNLIQELFLPRYIAFFARSREGFVATHVRGASPFPLHARVGPQEGVVPWAALKQLVLTPEDIASETGAMKGAYFSGPVCEFSYCVPIMLGETTSAVIIVGAFERIIPAAHDFASAVGVMTAQSLRSIQAITQQRRLAITDGLTGLLNKKYVQEYLQNELIPDASKEGLAVFLFDLDNFKHYNDQNGHLAGDDLLRSVSEVLQENTRVEEVLGRYGGEEFLMLMPGATKESALRGAERLRAAIAAQPFRFGEGQPLGRISISGGVAVFPEHGRSAGQLIEAADQALYEAKRAGRNRVIAFDGSSQVMHEDGKLEPHDDELEGAILLEEELVFGEEG